MPAALDWSWGQAIHSPTPFPSNAMLPQDPHTNAWSIEDPSSSTSALKPPNCRSNGVRVNEFRTAVPTPETESTMPKLELQSRYPHYQPVAGRKRSRTDVFEDDDSSEPHSSSSSDGMSASPNKIFRTAEDAMTATTQNGVRAEELAERLRVSAFADATGRPPVREARKSIRLDLEATMLERQQLQQQHSDMMVDGGVPSETIVAATHQRGPSGHDEAALTLGVGWASVPATPIMLAAARGWARYIESAFPLRNVRIVWKNEGISAVLISAVTLEMSAAGQLLPGSPGYYLFDENLTQGRLVAKSWERCLDLLRSQPMQFDGMGIMEAGNAPTNTWADATDVSNVEIGSGLTGGMELD